jgi:hypothetical protein
MQTEDLLTEYMRDMMLDIVAALYSNGIRQVHLGGMMRLVGVPESVAREYDNDRMEITDEFAAMIASTGKLTVPAIPLGTTIH